MSYKCIICSIEYKTHTGLWRHNKHHNIITENIITENIIIENTNKKVCINYMCSKCNKPYSSRQSKWKHQKTCDSKIPNIVNLYEQVKIMSNEINELKAKPSIINYNTTNNTLNRKIIIYNSPGTESIAYLSVSEQRCIMNKGLQSLMYLIKMTNFDKNKPENHSYCVTALNDKHASMIDIETNSIIKTEKTELFDKVLIRNIKKLESMAENRYFNINEKAEYKIKLEDLKNILFRSKRGTKVYYNELNLLSYNNKDLVYDTWNSLKSLDDIINSEEKTNKNIIKNNIIDFIESDTESDSSDSEINEIKIKNKEYIIENNYAYSKNINGTKGIIYGKYINGRIIKIK